MFLLPYRLATGLMTPLSDYRLPIYIRMRTNEMVSKDLSVVERLFDAFLCSHPALPLYVSAALLLRGAMLHTMGTSLQLLGGGEAGSSSNDMGTDRPEGRGRSGRGGTHVPLAQRPTAESVEVRTKGRAK